MSMMVWVGLGSNLGDREKNLEFARVQCRLLSHDQMIVSSIYETAAWGGVTLEPFLNQVIGFHLNQSELLSFIQRELTQVSDELSHLGNSHKERAWWSQRLALVTHLDFECEIHLKTSLAEHLMLALLLIERQCGRDRSQNALKWGSRTLDLDLLEVSGGLGLDGAYESPILSLPHPRLHERIFVLKPWAEIASSLYLPAHRATISQLYHSLLNKDQSESHDPSLQIV